MKLLVFNYSMNEGNQVFSHQRRIVKELSLRFEFIDVITSEKFDSSQIAGVNIRSTSWTPGRHLRNIWRFYQVAIPALWKHRRGVVFSHMTEVQSFLVAPICKMLGIRHFLWYAHKSKSFFLFFSHPFLSKLLTSTAGSCPIKSKKVIALGQAIDLEMTNGISREAKIPPMSWYHIGRIDPSKNLFQIIEALYPHHLMHPELSLHFYGLPSNLQSYDYFEALKKKCLSQEYSWINFHGQINHSEVSMVANSHDAFIHAFQGSLDKALVEAIVLKRIVVSSNPEYFREFKVGAFSNSVQSFSLQDQLDQLFITSREEIFRQINSNYEIACSKHGLANWIKRLTLILQGCDF
jgi:glycosyltransferase involved in cell wall biosynthesis